MRAIAAGLNVFAVAGLVVGLGLFMAGSIYWSLSVFSASVALLFVLLALL